MKRNPETWEDSKLDEFIESALIRAGSEQIPPSDVQAILAKVVEATNRWFSLIFHERFAEAAFDKLIEEYKARQILPFLEGDFDGDVDSSELLAKESRLYGYYGVLQPYARDGSPSPRWVDSLEEQTKHALEGCALTLPRLPGEWFATEIEKNLFDGLWVIFGKARARRRLDQGESLALSDVALLSGITLKSTSNATQKRHGDKRLVVGHDGRIQNENALVWLLDRKGFTPSPNMETRAGSTEIRPSRPEDFVFVPVDEDGNPFLPGCSIPIGPGSGRYDVMLDGTVEEIWDYFEALEAMTVADEFAWGTEDEWVSPVSWTKMERHRLRRMEFDLAEKARAKIRESEKIDRAQRQANREGVEHTDADQASEDDDIPF